MSEWDEFRARRWVISRPDDGVARLNAEGLRLPSEPGDLVTQYELGDAFDGAASHFGVGLARDARGNARDARGNARDALDARGNARGNARAARVAVRGAARGAARGRKPSPTPAALAAIEVVAGTMFDVAGTPRPAVDVLASLEAAWGGALDAGRAARIARARLELREAAAEVRHDAGRQVPTNAAAAAVAVAVAMGSRFFADACATPALFEYAAVATDDAEFYCDLLGF